MKVGTEIAVWAGAVQAPADTLFRNTPIVSHRGMVPKDKMTVPSLSLPRKTVKSDDFSSTWTLLSDAWFFSPSFQNILELV